MICGSGFPLLPSGGGPPVLLCPVWGGGVLEWTHDSNHTACTCSRPGQLTDARFWPKASLTLHSLLLSRLHISGGWFTCQFLLLALPTAQPSGHPTWTWLTFLQHREWLWIWLPVSPHPPLLCGGWGERQSSDALSSSTHTMVGKTWPSGSDRLVFSYQLPCSSSVMLATSPLWASGTFLWIIVKMMMV